MKFQLYYPVKPQSVNQPFGNPDPKYTALGLLGHNGIDFHAYHGQPIYASHDGVARYEIDNSSGHGVVIQTKDVFDYSDYPNGTHFKSIYWHLCDSSKEPQYRSPIEGIDSVEVKAGDLIGYADNTGLSTGDHLHFGIKPTVYNEPPGTWYNYAQGNGYLGAIDPAPYFNGLYAEDIKGKYLFLRDLNYGSFGTDVFQLQKRLVTEGVATFAPIGIYGPKTVAAVKAYQTKYGIDPVGRCGPLTRNQLNK